MDGTGLMLTAVISCDDRAQWPDFEDRAGALLRSELEKMGYTVAPPCAVARSAVLLNDAIRGAIDDGARVIVTVGASGILPGDIAPEVTRGIADFEVPGLMEEVRRVGAVKTRLSLLSRGIAAVATLPGCASVLIVNSLGSRGGVRDVLSVISPVLERIVTSLDGVEHDRS